MSAYWDIDAHSAYDMFSKYLIVNFICPTSVFGVGFFSDCAFSCSLPSRFFLNER